MAYAHKFQHLADIARFQVQGVDPHDVDASMTEGVVALYIRDPDEHAADISNGSINISRDKLEMLVEDKIPALSIVLLCHCNAANRGALSAASLKARATATLPTSMVASTATTNSVRAEGFATRSVSSPDAAQPSRNARWLRTGATG